MQLSIVIPAFNEVGFLGRCLRALAAQEHGGVAFDVTVVDNGSTDDTAGVARGCGEPLRLRVISIAKSPVSVARNVGAAACDGEILAFLDADCLVDAGWVERAVELEPVAGVWGAHPRIPEDATWVGRVWTRFQAREMSGPVSFLPGCTTLVRRVDFERLGGFAEEMETSEDVDFSRRARDAGLPVMAFPELAAVHLGTPRTWTHFYRQNRWHGRDVLPMFLANLPSTEHAGLVLLSVYACIMFWMVVAAAVLAVFSHHWLLPLIPLGGLFAVPLLLTGRKGAEMRTLRWLPSLFVLYTVYLLARAAALTSVASGRSLVGHRRTA